MDERRHAPTGDRWWGEEWTFDFATPDGRLGGYVRLGLLPNQGRCRYWAWVVGQCILAVDAFDGANGATEYVAGSHRSAPDEEGSGAPPCVERFEAEPGDLLIMHARTSHRAGLNTTTARRAAVVLSFVPRWVRPIISPRDVVAAIDDDMPEELRVLLGAVVYEEIDGRVVRREVL